MNDCLIPGCSREGIWVLGVRARLITGVQSLWRPSAKSTDAAWAPNLDAWFCDEHVSSGLLITVLAEPRKSGYTTVRALGAPDDHPHRRVKIQ